MKWSDVARIEAYKVDAHTTDDVCLALCTTDLAHIVDEETPGWTELVHAIIERFPVRADWLSVVAQPPFATNRSILWDRAAASAMQRAAPAGELWRQARADFQADGALRDIYISNTAVDDWNTTIALARGTCGDVTLSSGSGEPILHDLGERHFAGESRALVTIRVDGVAMIGHCFSAAEIELSFDPADVDGIERFAALVRFLAALAAVLQRTVRITPENLPDGPIIDIAPDGEARAIPAAAPRVISSER